MTSAVVDSGGSGLEFESSGIEIQDKDDEPVSDYPAVIVEPVPSARIEQGYAAQIFVYDDETYLLQDVAEVQEVETETVKTEKIPAIKKQTSQSTERTPSSLSSLPSEGYQAQSLAKMSGRKTSRTRPDSPKTSQQL